MRKYEHTYTQCAIIDLVLLYITFTSAQLASDELGPANCNAAMGTHQA